jgi:hypothetical protein
MTNPLDGNGVAAWPPRDWQCPECSYRSYCTFDADKGGPGSDLRCLNCKAVFRAPPAPSHTAVEPVAELVERLRDIVTEFDNEVADMMSNDGAERADLWVDVDVPIGIVRQADSALTAQAAALVAASERAEALMAERTNIIATKRDQLAAAESEAATLKARVAELEAGRQSEREAIAQMLTERARLARMVIETYCEPEAQIFEMLAREILSNEEAGK